MKSPIFSSFVLGWAVALLQVHCSAAPTPDESMKRQSSSLDLSGGALVMAPGTYPRANRLSDPSMPAGSIIGVYTGVDGADKTISVVTSQDNGASWQPRGEVSRAPSATTFLDHPTVLQLPGPNGRLLCVFANHDKDPASGAYSYYRLTVSTSDNFGQTWQFLDQAQEKAATPNNNGMWEPFLRNNLNGSQIQLYWSQEYSAADQDIVMTPSFDGGITWGGLTTVAGAGIISRDGMTGVTQTSGSQLMAVFESQDGQFTVKRVISPDDGQTWGSRELVYKPGGGQYTSAAAPQVTNVGGRLCVSFLTNEDNPPVSQTASSFSASTVIKVLISGDGGNSWRGKLTVGPPQSLWASLFDLDDDSFLALFDHGGSKAQNVIVG